MFNLRIVSKMQNMRERRRFTRIPFEEEVEFISKKGSSTGRIRNFSLGGLFVETIGESPEIGEEIALILLLKDTEPPIKIFMKGEVLRQEPWGFAVRITGMNEESFHHLKNFVQYRYGADESILDEIKTFVHEFHPLQRALRYLDIYYIKGELTNFILERAFLYSPDKPFVLSSGRTSPYYLDCRKITLFGPAFKLIGELFWTLLREEDIEGVAGMSIGADPIVCSILASALEEEVDLEGLLIRKEPKKYGTGKQIEGNYWEGMRIALVEDVVTTGGSLIKAIEACEREKLKIVKIIALIDREEGGKENLKEKGYNLQSFFTLSEIISYYHRKKSQK